MLKIMMKRMKVKFKLMNLPDDYRHFAHPMKYVKYLISKDKWLFLTFAVVRIKTNTCSIVFMGVA